MTNYIKLGEVEFEYFGKVKNILDILDREVGMAYEILDDEDYQDLVIPYQQNIQEEDLALDDIHEDLLALVKDNKSLQGLYRVNNEFTVILKEGYNVSSKDIKRMSISSDELRELVQDKIINTRLNKKKIESIRNAKVGTDGSGSDFMKYEIDELDDSLVVLLKQTVNDQNITYDEFYSNPYWDNDEGDAWNFIYGLRIRKSITWASFLTWMDVLGLEVDISLKPKGDIPEAYKLILDEEKD